jgi:hypothetical protein
MDYTSEDLVREAHERGFGNVTPRQVVDWVRIGLIDKAARHGLGSGGGRGSRKGTWSRFQRDLFLREVEQHHETARKIPTLCNLPVFVWSWWGDEWVPVRQAMRAMTTYSQGYRKSSERAARDTAKEIARDLGNPGGSHQQRRVRQAFIETLAEMGPSGRLTERDKSTLAQLARQVFDPRLQASPFATNLAEGYVQLIEARLTAIKRLPCLGVDDFFWARHVYVVTRAGYGQDYSRLAQDPAIAKAFQPPTLQEIGNRACVELLTVLGLVEMSKQELDPAKGGLFDPRRSPLMASFGWDPNGTESVPI